MTLFVEMPTRMRGSTLLTAYGSSMSCSLVDLRILVRLPMMPMIVIHHGYFNAYLTSKLIFPFVGMQVWGVWAGGVCVRACVWVCVGVCVRLHVPQPAVHKPNSKKTHTFVCTRPRQQTQRAGSERARQGPHAAQSEACQLKQTPAPLLAVRRPGSQSQCQRVLL